MTKQMQILFVDDDVDDREFFVDALSYVNVNLKCMVAKNCDDAFTILQSATSPPKYIFLDIHMPAMDGKNFLQAIKTDPRYKDTKVVMYSNSSDQALMEEYKKLGATYFLIKPPTFKALCDSLSVLLES